MNVPFSSYNIIISYPSFNLLWVALSTSYLTLNYLLDNWDVNIVRGDQEVSKWCSQYSLKLKPSKIKYIPYDSD